MSASTNDIPMVKPTEFSGKKTTKPLVEISEEEQWRLINESGVLKKIPKPGQQADASEEPEEISFGEEMLNTILYVVPFSFLLVMMDMWVLILKELGLCTHETQTRTA
jgi:hypothetical protein